MPPAVSNRPSKAGPGNDAPAQQVFPTRWRAVLALTVLFAVALAGPSRAEHASLPTGIAALAAAAANAQGCQGAPDHREAGMASWYGKRFQGRPTASGKAFDMYAMTAAHRTLPLGSKIRVTNRSNGKAVLLTVNDRGPYIDGRVLDVSYAAARELGFVRKGLAKVRVETLSC